MILNSANKKEEPKFVLSKKKILEQWTLVNEICDVVSYSSKTNPLITKILEKNTCSLFSIHLINELKHVKDKSRVLFFAQGWDQQDLKELINMNVTSFVVDNEFDLDELVSFLEKRSIKVNLFLRARLQENTIKTERYFVFGMPSEIINKRIVELRTNEKIKNKIKQLGIHFHRKTQNMSEWNLKNEFEDIIDEKIFSLIDIVNIGGGLPAEYANTNKKVIETIFEKINEFRKWLNKEGMKMMVEPGRFIAAPSGKLQVEIVRMYNNNIIVNASVYNSDMDALIVPVKLLVENEFSANDPDVKPYAIKGATPCSMDIYRYKVYMKNPQVGDKIVFLNAGAYNFSTDFCELEKIKTDVLEDFMD
ncbi:MAG: decarboxylase [Nanoarchaeota archaeon]|nr:decarboxylase [Nanoarchaeota archaeon]